MAQWEWQVCVLFEWDEKRQLGSRAVTREGTRQGFTQVSSAPSPTS